MNFVPAEFPFTFSYETFDLYKHLVPPLERLD